MHYVLRLASLLLLVSFAQTNGQSDAQADAKADAPPAQPDLELIGAGAEPRARLEYTPTPDHEQLLVMVTDIEMQQFRDGQEMPPLSIRDVEMSARFRMAAAASPRFTSAFEYFAPGLVRPDQEAPPAAPKGPEAESVPIAKGTLVFTRQGMALSSEITWVQSTDPRQRQQLNSLDQSIRQLIVPLPDDPIGIGASWRLRYTVSPSGLTLHEDVLFTLLAVTDSTFEVEMALSQGAPEQMAPAQREGAERMRMVEQRLAMKGRLRLNYEMPLPIAGRLDIESHARFEVENEAGAEEVIVEAQGSLSISSTPEATSKEADAPASDPMDELYTARREALESALGKSHDDVLASMPPFFLGGNADVLVFEDHVDGATAYATYGLIGDDQPKPNAHGQYELMICVRGAFVASDEVPATLEWAPSLISRLARYTTEAVLSPGDTMTIGPALPQPTELENLLFVHYADVQVLEHEGGLLLCIGITEDERQYLAEHGQDALIAKLRDSGVYPLTDLSRRSVLAE